jgi:hypothetical protein
VVVWVFVDMAAFNGGKGRAGGPDGAGGSVLL